MQPRPIADTCRLLFPSLRFCIITPSRMAPRRRAQESFLFDQACREHDSVAVVMQLDGEDKYVPVPVWALNRQMRGPLKSAPVNVGFTGIGYGAHDVAPFVSHLRKLLEQVLADKPSSLVSIHCSKVVVHVLPGSFAIEDLQDNVVAHCHRNA